MATFESFGIDIRGATSGEVKTTCPRCSPQRRKAKYPCLNVNVEKGIWHCWHCEWAGTLKGGEDRSFMGAAKKEWKRPNIPNLSPGEKWRAWLEKRGVPKHVQERNRITQAMIYMPQTEQEEDSIVFPYLRRGEVVNAKYRDAAKNFRMAAGAERILYGLDDIEPAALVWVEGEVDKLSVETAGFLSCVSVPDGAPSPSTKNYAEKFSYLDTAQETLHVVDRHIIAVDADPPGQKLQEELIRRLGAEKCWLVKWPEGCKDANDVLVSRGEDALRRCIEDAKPAPIAGIIQPVEVWDQLVARYSHGARRGKPTGWANIDELYTVREGEWTAITGIPGHGKSEWLDALMVNLAVNFGWKFGVCSPENQPLEEHVQKILEKVTGMPFFDGPRQRMGILDLAHHRDWINDHFAFILPEEPTLDEILLRAKALVHRQGISGLVIDPWNEIEFTRDRNITETEHISKSLSTIRKFARTHQVHVWVVAHPTKLHKDRDTGKYPVPTLYDISGSAHWRNKADNGLTIFRHVDQPDKPVEVHVGKIRFKVVGKVGVGLLKYDRATGRYSE